MLTDSILTDHQNLSSTAGIVKLPLTILKMSGADRKSFLHNFCTNEIKALEDGKICEAFILNGKGKLLGLVHVIAAPNVLYLVTVPGQFELLNEHLDRYIIREDVSISDVSKEFECHFLCGPQASERLAGLLDTVPDQGGFLETDFSGEAIKVANIELAGQGFLLMSTAGSGTQLIDSLTENGTPICSTEAFHVLRIENGTPWFTVDATDSNLPQELQRNEKSISFNKGCYLGQETVARIDAIGHVNQFLTTFQLSDEAAQQAELMKDDKKVGKLTSVTWSPKHNGWIALGYIKRQLAKSGTEVQVGSVTATVI